jgi:hypothetical protein
MLDWKVGPVTLKRYRKCLIDSLDWAEQNGWTTCKGAQELDEFLCCYLEYLYENNLGKTTARNCICAWKHFVPEVKHKLPMVTQCMNGWEKHSPPISYPPLTKEVAHAVAVDMARQSGGKYWRLAAGVLIAFDLFLRCGELLNLRYEDIADVGDERISVSLHKEMVVVLKKTKTGRNQNVRVRDPQIVQLIRNLLDTTAPRGYLFPFTPGVFRAVFKKSLVRLGLSNKYTLHSLRHGGATHCYQNLNWTFEDVQYRGRWKSAESCKIYLQESLALLLAKKAPDKVVRDGLVFSKDPSYFIIPGETMETVRDKVSRSQRHL